MKRVQYNTGARAEYQPASDITLELTDGTSTSHVLIKIVNKVSSVDDSAPLFNGQYGNHHRSSAFAYFGKMYPLTGPMIPVIVNYNMNGKFNVVALKGGDSENPILQSEGYQF